MSRNAKLIQRSENDVHAGYQEAMKRAAFSKAPNSSRLVTFIPPGKQRGESPQKKLGSIKESTNVQGLDTLKARLRENGGDFKAPLGLSNRNQNDVGKPSLVSAGGKSLIDSKQVEKLSKQSELTKLLDRANLKLNTRAAAKPVTKVAGKSFVTTKQSENVAQKILGGDVFKAQNDAALTQKPFIETRSRAAAKKTEPMPEKMEVCSSRDADVPSPCKSEEFASAYEYLGGEMEDKAVHQEISEVNRALKVLRTERDNELANMAGALHLGSASRLARSRQLVEVEESEADDERESEDSTEQNVEVEPTKSRVSSKSSRIESDTPNLINDPELRRTLQRFEAGDPQLLAEFVDDHFAHMRTLEATRMAIRRGYMMAHWEVKPRYRELAFDWLVCVAQRFNLLPETYYLATHLFDRFMQQSPVPRVQIQLVAIASLYVASKLEETYLPDVSDFLFVTDDAISRAELFEAERKLLDTLQFAVNAPNPLIFLRRYSRIFQYSLMLARREDEEEPSQLGANGYTPGWLDVAQRIDVRRVHQLSKYLLETSIYDYEMAHVGASQRVAASLLLAMRAVAWPRNQLSAENLDAHIGMQDDLVLELSGNTANNFTTNVTSRTNRNRAQQSLRLPSMWTIALARHTEHGESELLPIVRRLAFTIARTRRDAKLQSTRTKYSDPQFDSIARGVELEIVLQRGEQLIAAKNVAPAPSASTH